MVCPIMEGESALRRARHRCLRGAQRRALRRHLRLRPGASQTGDDL